MIMYRLIHFSLIVLFSISTVFQVFAEDNPKRLSRKDSFLGIHFDFHAGYDCTEIGKTVTPEMIERIIDLVHPDYIQCDSKGHSGISSYPTKVGHPAPGFVRDQLHIWRDVTAKDGVAVINNSSVTFLPETGMLFGITKTSPNLLHILKLNLYSISS